MIITREWLDAKLKQMEAAGVDEIADCRPPISAIRAKMSVQYVSDTGGNSDCMSVNLGCVYSSDPKSENKSFSDSTPAGSLSLQIQKNKPAAKFLENGDIVYVDISIVERNPWKYMPDGNPPHASKIIATDDWENPTFTKELTVRVNKRSDNRPTYADYLDAEGNVVESTYPRVVPDSGLVYWRFATQSNT